MRILFDIDDIWSIKEIKTIDLIPSWDFGLDVETDPPSLVSLLVDGDYIGNFITNKTYKWEDVINDYHKMLNCLLVNGYYKASDLKNFEWY